MPTRSRPRHSSRSTVARALSGHDEPATASPRRRRSPLPPRRTPAPAADTPPADSVAAFRDAVLDKLTYMVGKDPGHAQEHDWFVATALAVRDRIVDRWMDATRKTYRDGRKRVYYFSLEFLIGRLLFDALGNLGLTATAREALRDLGVDLDRLRKLEPDAALGNGGLGRLAACFMESMATLRHPRPRLRHPLRPRHLPPGAEGRLAARAARGLAVVGQPVGVRAAGGHLHDRLRRHRRQPSRARTATTRSVWEPGGERQRGGLRHADRRLARPARQHAAAVVGAGVGPAAARGLQPRRSRRRARRPRAARSDLARALPQRRDAGRARAAAAAGVSSSPPRRCRTSCAGTRRSTASSRRSPTTSRSS